MYVQQALVYLAAAGLASASIVAVRAPLGVLEARAVQQGWSLQASSAPAGTTSCGSGSFCPSSLKCNPAATAEVAACCTSGDCRGSVEGAPTCADDSWSLWKGYNGNGFCCTSDQVGSYDSTKPIAGTCGSSVAAGATSAQIVSPLLPFHPHYLLTTSADVNRHWRFRSNRLLGLHLCHCDYHWNYNGYFSFLIYFR
jgi:glucan endo-1,3-alpha-glucosidase